jgi:hypothetical protein
VNGLLFGNRSAGLAAGLHVARRAAYAEESIGLWQPQIRT